MAYKGLSAYANGEPIGPDELADVQEELRRLQTENVSSIHSFTKLLI